MPILYSITDLATSIILFAIIPIAVKLLFRFCRKIKSIVERHKTKSLIFKNIKSSRPFLDHSRRIYEIDSSSIELTGSKYPTKDLPKYIERIRKTNTLYLSEGINMASPSISPITTKVKTLRVEHISHNRLSEKEKDEANWFHIKLFISDNISDILFNNITNQLNPSILYESLRESTQINQIVPFIGNAAFTASIYFKYKDLYYTILKKDRNNAFSFPLSHELSLSDFDKNKIDIQSLTDNLIRKEINRINPYYKKEYRVYLYELGTSPETLILHIYIACCIYIQRKEEYDTLSENAALNKYRIYKLECFNRDDTARDIDPHCKEIQINLRHSIKKFK